MRIKIDGKYQTRDGRPVRIYATDTGGDYPIHGAIWYKDQWLTETWQPCGRCWGEVDGALGPGPLDLVVLPSEPTYRPFQFFRKGRVMIELGKKGRDKITGFEGILIGRSTWLTGCEQYCLCPTVDKEGKIRDSAWFDEVRVEVLAEVPVDVSGERRGGPNVDLPRGAY